MKNQQIELVNGEVVQLTMNFAKILKIKQDNPNLYNELQEILKGNIDPVFSPVKVLYTSYLCANNEPKYTEEQFIELVPFDLQMVNEVSARLIQATKQK